MKKLLLIILLISAARCDELYRTVRFASSPSHAEVKIGGTTVGKSGEPTRVPRSLFQGAEGKLEGRPLTIQLPDHAEAKLPTIHWDQLQEGKEITADDGKPFVLKPDHFGILLMDHRLEVSLLLLFVGGGAGLTWLRSRRHLDAAQTKLEQVELVKGEVQEDLAQLATRKELEADHWLQRTIGGYLTQKRIGVGAQGSVYRATRQTGDGPDLAAVKICSAPSSDPDEIREFKARIQRECTAPSRISSPYILRYFATGEINDTTCYLIMEFIEGSRDLHDWMKAHPNEPEVFLELLQKVASGLRRAHEGQVLHRDLKPENILVTREMVPKIADFGVALDALRTKLTQGLAFFGTPAYMAPEVARFQDGTAASDQYALGIMIYEYLSGGTIPHLGGDINAILQARGRQPVEAIAGLSTRVNLSLLKMLDILPENRYPDVETGLNEITATYLNSKAGGGSSQ
ncbi:serine/threonine protein kinase [bacterium]|nr:serine/threonine protein kinase [bacterium]